MSLAANSKLLTIDSDTPSKRSLRQVVLGPVVQIFMLFLLWIFYLFINMKNKWASSSH